ncbi:MAG: metallophosphoesterase [Ignavibacteriaceae bacterium]|jgi:predicted phosphodiesterase
MGYRFSIRNINAVGHLVEGNVITFLKQCASSEELLQPNIDFLDGLIRRTEEDFYTSEYFWRNITHDIDKLRSDWDKIKEELYSLRRTNDNELNLRKHEKLLYYLKRLSNILSRCKIKSILLPGFKDNELNEIILDKQLLRELVRIHPGDTALILQMKERIQEKEIELLNVFKRFDKALNRVEQWPGVLLWNDNDSIFLPITRRYDLHEIFEILRYERSSFDFLREQFDKKEKRGRYSYLFHLSDLHFGNKIAERRKIRVVRILENHLSQLEEDSKAIPIITGDLMNTPNRVNKQAYFEFIEMIVSKGFEKPIHILGNHDVDTSGFVKFMTGQKSVIQALSSDNKIEIIAELNLGIIKFNSNTGGEFAQGKIGEDQFIEIGNEYEHIENRKELTFIAILHHHPMKVENPYWYSRPWYKALLGDERHEETMKLIDADIFLQWIEQRNIKIILHGHKHIPRINKHKDISVIGAGSSTGSVKHIDIDKTFLTYNLIKYDNQMKKPVTCSIIAEETLGAGTKNILIQQI